MNIKQSIQEELKETEMKDLEHYTRENVMKAFVDYPKLHEYISINISYKSKEMKSSSKVDFTDKFKEEFNDLYIDFGFVEDIINEVLYRWHK